MDNSQAYKKTEDIEFYELVGKSIAIFQTIMFSIKDYRFSYIRNNFIVDKPPLIAFDDNETCSSYNADQIEELNNFFDKKSKLETFLFAEMLGQTEEDSIDRFVEILKNVYRPKKFNNLRECLTKARTIRNSICHAEYRDTVHGHFLKHRMTQQGKIKIETFDNSFVKNKEISKHDLKMYVRFCESLLHVCSDICYQNRACDASTDLRDHFIDLEKDINK